MEHVLFPIGKADIPEFYLRRFAVFRNGGFPIVRQFLLSKDLLDPVHAAVHHRQAGGLAGLRLGASGGNETGTGDVSHPQLMHKAEGSGIIPIQAAQRRVHRRHQARRHSVADTLHRVIEARCAHQRIVDGGIGAVQRHLHAVKACLIQPAAQLRRQQTTVGVETGHEPLGGLHQFHQICPKWVLRR